MSGQNFHLSKAGSKVRQILTSPFCTNFFCIVLDVTFVCFFFGTPNNAKNIFFANFNVMHTLKMYLRLDGEPWGNIKKLQDHNLKSS